MQAISGGLGVNGTMMVIGAVGALIVNSLDLLGKRAAVRGWYSGTAVDSEDALLFSRLNGIASMNEIFPLEEADYAMPRAHDAPNFTIQSHPVPAKTNTLGVKGCGEAGCAGALPSIMNAVVDALGGRHIDMPATPEKVGRLLNEQP